MKLHYNYIEENSLDAVHCPYPSKVEATCAKFTYV